MAPGVRSCQPVLRTSHLESGTVLDTPRIALVSVPRRPERGPSRFHGLIESRQNAMQRASGDQASSSIPLRDYLWTLADCSKCLRIDQTFHRVIHVVWISGRCP
jgi:hypothetical protein